MSNPISYVQGQHNTIGAIVDHVLFKKTLHSSWYQWCLEMGLWHLRELKLSTWQDVKTEIFTASDRNTIVMPSDFIDLVMVAVPVGQYAVPLGVNGQLKMTARKVDDHIVPGLFSQHKPTGIELDQYVGYHMRNYRATTVPVLNARFNIQKGSFNLVDRKTYKEIILDYDVPFSQFYVEYITDGFEPCGETVLHPYFCDFVRTAIEFEWEQEKNPKATEASIFRKGQDKADAERLVRARKNNLDPQTLINMQRQETRMTSHF